MANNSAPSYRVEEVLQQPGNLESDNSGEELTENEDEHEVEINEPRLDNDSSSSNDDESEATCKTNWIELNKIKSRNHQTLRQEIEDLVVDMDDLTQLFVIMTDADCLKNGKDDSIWLKVKSNSRRPVAQHNILRTVPGPSKLDKKRITIALDAFTAMVATAMISRIVWYTQLLKFQSQDGNLSHYWWMNCATKTKKKQNTFCLFLYLLFIYCKK